MTEKYISSLFTKSLSYPRTMRFAGFASLLALLLPVLATKVQPGTLGDPTLDLHDGNGALIAANDNWRTDQEAEIIATTVPPSSDLESAMVQDLAPGHYTAIVRGVINSTGVAVVEAYGLD